MAETEMAVIACASSPARSTLSGCNVLVVEDEYVLALDLQYNLESSGVNVLGPVGSVEDALNVVETLPDLDAAVLDLSLRGEKSYRVADALNQRGVPFVFATGYDMNLVPEQYSAAPVCQKPVSAAALTAALARLLTSRSRERFSAPCRAPAG